MGVVATTLREQWMRERTPMAERRPELLAALADLHHEESRASAAPSGEVRQRPGWYRSSVRVRAIPSC